MTTKEDTDNHDDHHDDNSGTMIADVTCDPSDIRFPQDVALLDEACENAEQIIDAPKEQSNEKKPRTYRKKAHIDNLKYMRSRKRTEKKICEAIRKQFQYFHRDLSIIESMLKSGLLLSKKGQKRFDTLRGVYEQQKYMLDNRPYSDRPHRQDQSTVFA